MTMETHSNSGVDSGGPVAWMTRNRITPNLLMLILLIGGFLVALRMKGETIPEITGCAQAMLQAATRIDVGDLVYYAAFCLFFLHANALVLGARKRSG